MHDGEFDFASAFLLEPETGQLFWKQPPKQHAEKLGREAGYLLKGVGKNKSYWQVRVFGKTFKRARIVFYMTHGRWPMPTVDHINGNSLDDRPANLREATFAQQAMNSKARRRPFPKGVLRTRQGRFMARITVDGVTKSLGVYDTPEMARAVYETARKEAFHAFA